MNKKIMIIGVICLFLTASFGYVNAKCIQDKTVEIMISENTIYVDDDNTEGPWDGTTEHPYQFIQAAINAAENTDTVYVFSGTYSVSDENDIVIEKTINLIGENKETTIISATGFDYHVIRINADYVTFSGFTVRDAIRGIICNSDYCNVYENIIIDNADGLQLSKASHNAFSRNIITSNMNGITIESSSIDNNISFCDVNENIRGIEIANGCNSNIIFKNNVIKNAETGISIHSDNNILINNSVKENCYGILGAGVYLNSASNNKIIGNIISENSLDGIVLTESSNRNVIYENIIKNNVQTMDIGWYGIYIVSSSNNNVIYHNDFIKNNWGVISHNAFDSCNNIWYDSTLKEGNYFDDYAGIDSDGDGIGDVAYKIPGGNNRDRYPLMQPYGRPKSKTINSIPLFIKFLQNFPIIYQLFQRLINL